MRSPRGHRFRSSSAPEIKSLRHAEKGKQLLCSVCSLEPFEGHFRAQLWAQRLHDRAEEPSNMPFQLTWPSLTLRPRS